MTITHYPAQLLRDYELLLTYFPSHTICRPFVIEAIEKWQTSYQKTNKLNILEIGPGYGETTELIHEKIPASFTLVEQDELAMNVLKTKFKEMPRDFNYIQEDATAWITSQPSHTFDVFTASWVLHNFPAEQRTAFIEQLYRVLKPGGLFIIFDKVLPNNSKENDAFWKIHMNRLDHLEHLGRTKLKNEMVAHEIRDSQEPFVWFEKDLVDTIKKTWV